MHDTYTLFGTQGCGSTIVAAALALTAFPWGYEEVDYTQDGPERDRLLALNPLGQVPTLVLPNDEVMTESAAIILLLHDRAPHAELAPPGGSPLLPRFLRWLLFINAEIYPHLHLCRPSAALAAAGGGGGTAEKRGNGLSRAFIAAAERRRRRSGPVVSRQELQRVGSVRGGDVPLAAGPRVVPATLSAAVRHR